MKILVVATSIVPGNSLGIEHFTYRIISALSTHYPTVEIIVLIPRNSQKAWLQRLPTNSNIRIQPMRISPAAYSSFFTRSSNRIGRFLGWLKTVSVVRHIYSQIKKMELLRMIKKHHPDIIFSPFHIEDLVFGLGKVVLVVHDLREVMPEFFDKKKSQTLITNINKSNAVTIAWLHPFEQFLTLFPKQAHKAFLIPFPIPIANPQQEFSPTLAADDQEIIIFASALRKQKNHINLIRAMPAIINARAKVGKQVSLICAGTTYSPLYESLLEEAERLGVKNQVCFTGFISDVALQALYEKSTMVVSPTLWEAASGAVFEGFSFGKPVACSQIPPIISQVKQAGALVKFFDPSDPQDIAAAVLDVLENPSEYIAGARRGAAFLRSLSWELTAFRYMDLFIQLANED